MTTSTRHKQPLVSSPHYVTWVSDTGDTRTILFDNANAAYRYFLSIDEGIAATMVTNGKRITNAS